jgi:hypothetical protein
MPSVEWDYSTPIYSTAADKYFFSEEDYTDWCYDNKLNPEEVLLVECCPTKPSLIDADIWQDELPEDCGIEDVFSQDILKRIAELNKLLSEHKPISWYPGKKRVHYKGK